MTSIERSKNPYPFHCSPELWGRIESIKDILLGMPKYSEIFRAAIELGLAQMASMPQEQLAKVIRGF